MAKNSLLSVHTRETSVQPLRVTMETFSRDTKVRALRRLFDCIRDTFKKHTPAIMVGEHIGSGGFADVFKATSSYDGVTDFAIKILRTDLLEIRKGSSYNTQEEEMRVKDVKRRFTNESYVQWDLCKSLSETVSRSVVRVFDFGEFDHKNDFRFILMEQMGSTLRDYLNDKRHMVDSWDVLLYKTKLMLTIAEIIGNVHLEGIFHRDIKPENILFPRGSSPASVDKGNFWRREGAKTIEVKLADFGTVRWVKAYTDKYDGVIIGSPLYLSPEQIQNPEQLDLRTDIYSFGVVCYELLFGTHPKPVDKSGANVIVKLAREKPVVKTPPKGFEPLSDIIFKCMGEISERYQSMEQVVGELTGFFNLVNG
jgi:serine/threonine protein kinase